MFLCHFIVPENDKTAKDCLRNELHLLSKASCLKSFEERIEKCRKTLSKCADPPLTNYLENYWLATPDRWVLFHACIKSLARDKPRLYLDLDEPKSRMSCKSTFSRTRRLIPIQEVIQDVLKEYFPQVMTLPLTNL